jgi:ABC-type polar amino acid transport system ATPase subunit
MQRIVIKNFGPLKEVDLEIKDLMLFIGPQASGKSTIAKLIYFFRSVLPSLDGFIVQKLLTNTYNLEFFAKSFFSCFSKIFVNETTEITFHYNENYFCKLNFSQNELVRLEENLIEKIGKLIQSDLKVKEKNSFHFDFGTIINNFEDCKFLEGSFIPTNRAMFNLLDHTQIASSSLEGVQLFKEDFWMSQYFKYLNNLRKRQSESLVHLKEIDFNKLLRISGYKIKKNFGPYEDWIILPDEKTELPIHQTSSGQQEALFIVLSIAYYLMKGHWFTIEEPEISLYPESQKHLVDLFGLYLNTHKDNQLVITTHSPYILTAFNNLIYAHQVGQKKEKEVSEIIPNEMWIDPTRVGAYFVDEGKARDIVDPELNLIKAEEIDSASDQMSQQYSKLFDLDYENE